MFLDCISLTARHTDQTFDELWNYVEQGKLLQMAVLFVAAHKQIRAITLEDKDGKSITAMEVILRRIDDVVLSLHRETGEIHVKPKKGCSLKKCKLKMEAMALSRIIFQLIEKIGDSLDEFRQNVHSEVSHKEAAEYDTSLFAREGLRVKKKDIDLSNLDWCCYPDNKQVEKSKGHLVYPPQPNCDQPPYKPTFDDLTVHFLKSLSDWPFKRFIPTWNSVLSVHADREVNLMFRGNGRALPCAPLPLHKIQSGIKGPVLPKGIYQLGRHYSTVASMIFPLRKIESGMKGPVLPVGNYQLGRHYSTAASMILRVIRRV